MRKFLYIAVGAVAAVIIACAASSAVKKKYKTKDIIRYALMGW